MATCEEPTGTPDPSVSHRRPLEAAAATLDDALRNLVSDSGPAKRPAMIAIGYALISIDRRLKHAAEALEAHAAVSRQLLEEYLARNPAILAGPIAPDRIVTPSPDAVEAATSPPDEPPT